VSSTPFLCSQFSSITFNLSNTKSSIHLLFVLTVPFGVSNQPDRIQCNRPYTFVLAIIIFVICISVPFVIATYSIVCHMIFECPSSLSTFILSVSTSFVSFFFAVCISGTLAENVPLCPGIVCIHNRVFVRY
jgi:hypothetical protein